MFSIKNQLVVPGANEALLGRDEPMFVAASHFVNGNTLVEPFPDKLCKALFGLGCFWGAEKKFWLQKGVYSTAVGYAAGHTKNPTYEEVCSGLTAHNEVVLVLYDEAVCRYEQLVKMFFESHNPTQGMQQGNDKGTQYRSGIYYFNAQQKKIADSLKLQYQSILSIQGMPEITTEIIESGEFYYAEDYHQQYLAKNPNGYCGLGGTGLVFD